MSRRRKVLVCVTGVALPAILALAGLRLFRNRKLKNALERATGMQCSVGSVSFLGDKACDIALSSGDGLHIHIGEARVRGRRKNLMISGIRLDLPEGVPADSKGLRITLLYTDSLLSDGYGDFAVLAGGRLTELNPALKRYGQVVADKGEFFAKGNMEIRSEGGLSGDLQVEFTDFVTRSLDGRFEFEAEEVTATIKIAGTLKAPKLDLGELEPYLGKKFVESFKEFKP